MATHTAHITLYSTDHVAKTDCAITYTCVSVCVFMSDALGKGRGGARGQDDALLKTERQNSRASQTKAFAEATAAGGQTLGRPALFLHSVNEIRSNQLESCRAVHSFQIECAVRKKARKFYLQGVRSYVTLCLNCHVTLGFSLQWLHTAH